MEKGLKTVDLFCGCGGLSLGFQKEGFDIVAAFDGWDAAVENYGNNFDHPVAKLDLSDVENAVETIKEYTLDVIIGGPPCQDFSSSGMRVEAGRAHLTECYAEIVAECGPKCFVMENVPGARKSDAYRRAMEIFKAAGYGLTEVVLNASLCGCPQKRKRFFCFGMKGADDGFADELFERNLADRPMTVRDYFGKDLEFEYYYFHPRSYSRRGVYSVDEPAPTMRAQNRPMPKNYKGHPNDSCAVFPGLRALTTAERLKIQTFPDTFRLSGTKTEIEQMVGNAVPVNLARYVARVAKYCEEN